MPSDQQIKHFAWDGMEFPIPEDWDLSGYTMRRRIASLRFEDPTSIRMELDWTSAAGRKEVIRVRDQHARFAERLHETALSVEALSDISDRWVVFLYTMPESRRLLTALHVGEMFPLFVFVRLHAIRCSRREIVRDGRVLIEGFRYQREGPVAWRFYDVDWRVPRTFRLVQTSLLAGRKMMLFEYRLRRLYLWRLSLADRLMHGRSPGEVAAEFLNKFKGLPGVRFRASPDNAENLIVRRYRWHPFGQYEEIGRLCFRYWTNVEYSQADNSLTIAVFNHRRAADLRLLDGLTLNEKS